MAHYALYNVSATTQISAQNVYKSFAMLAETFVFSYLGIFAGISLEELDQKWSAGMILFAIVKKKNVHNNKTLNAHSLHTNIGNNARHT